MKPLAQSYKIFTLLCICPPVTSTRLWIKVRNVVFTVFTLCFFIMASVSSAIFIARNYRTDLSSTLCAILQMAAVAEPMYTTIMAYVLHEDIQKVFDALQNFYDSYQDTYLSAFLKVANQRSEWIVKAFVNIFAISCPLTILAECFGSAIYSQIKFGYLTQTRCIIHSNLSEESLPWDQHSVFGWMGESVFGALSVFFLIFVNPAFLTFFISICEYHAAFYKMFISQIDDVDIITRKRPSSHRDRDVKKYLCETITFHISCKRLFHQTARVYSTFILIQLIGSMVLLACAIFQLDWLIRHFNVMIIITIFSISNSGLNLGLYCFYGHRTTQNYSAFGNYLYNSSWMTLPVDQQKFFILMIAHAQIPLNFHGYGLVHLNLGTFVQILRSVVSFFLMFKIMTKE